MRRHILNAAAGLVCLIAFLLQVPAQAGDFYTPAPGELAGKPGSIIRSEAFAAPPGAAAAYRVLYRSTDGGGRPIAVSGLVVVPKGPAPAGGRPLVSWAHATSGVAQGCARTMYPSIYSMMYGLPDMLARGYVVAATDYPGLGAPGIHPYLIGVDQGRAVLDMARAARSMPEAQAGSAVALAGYSQGGHATLYAGILAGSYAPDLKVVGIAASAPPTNLAALIREMRDDPISKVFVTYTLASWSKLYGLPLDGVVEPRVRLVVNNIARSCNMEFGQSLKLMFAEQAFEREGFLKGDIINGTEWKKLLVRNSPGPTPAGVPVFLAQGTTDPIVRPNVTQAYADRLCARGTRLTLVPIKGGHKETGPIAGKPMVDWIAARFAGKPAPSDCGEVRALPGKKAAADPAMVRAPVPAEKRFDVVDAKPVAALVAEPL